MANEFYITAGLVAIDSADSPPIGDNKFFITAGLVANDYVAASSWAHDVDPVASANINEVDGVAKANIADVDGVE